MRGEGRGEARWRGVGYAAHYLLCQNRFCFGSIICGVGYFTIEFQNTDRESGREGGRGREKEGEIERVREREKEGEGEREEEDERERGREREERERDRQTDRDGEREGGYRQTDKDRGRDRQRETETDREEKKTKSIARTARKFLVQTQSETNAIIKPYWQN